MAFLRFYERRNKFRYQLKQDLKEKNRWKENFHHVLYKNLMGMNSEEIIWTLLKKKEYIPIDIIYEPTLDENKEIEWFFAPDISLSYVGYIEKIRNNEKYMEIRITR